MNTIKHLLPQVDRYFKTNLHTHSTISDGKLTREEVKEAYNKSPQAQYINAIEVFNNATKAEDFDKALKVTQIMNKLCYIFKKLHSVTSLL